MTPRNILGIALVVLGAFALAYNGFTYTRRHTVLQVGSLKATDNEQHTIPLSPALGAGLVVAGVLVLLVGRRSANS